MSFDPPLLPRTILLSMQSDSTWATTVGPSLPGVTPATILGIPGFQLQHPQPCLTQATFGTTFSSPTVPTSLWEPVPLITEPLPQTMPTIPVSLVGTTPYRTRSSHLSLYQPLRSPSPDPLNPADPPGETVTDNTLHPSPNDPTHHSTNTESQSGSEGGQVRQVTQTPLQIHSLRQSMSMESTGKVPSCPQSCRSTHSIQQTLTLPPMMLSDTIHIYEMTRFEDFDISVLEILVQVDYDDLYRYIAYELPFILAWGNTEAGNDYFMNQQQGLPSDQILQYEAGRNACLLYNKIHQDAPMQVLSPYRRNMINLPEIEIQEPISDEPLVPSP